MSYRLGVKIVLAKASKIIMNSVKEKEKLMTKLGFVRCGKLEIKDICVTDDNIEADRKLDDW